MRMVLATILMLVGMLTAATTELAADPLRPVLLLEDTGQRLRLVVPTGAGAGPVLERRGVVTRLRFEQPVAMIMPLLPESARRFLTAIESRDDGRQLVLALGAGVDAALGARWRGSVELVLTRPGTAQAAASSPAPAPDPAPAHRVSAGKHPGKVRLVVEGGPSGRVVVDREGDTIRLRLPLTAPEVVARQVAGQGPPVIRVVARADGLDLFVAPGTTLRESRERPGRLVLDLLAPGPVTADRASDPALEAHIAAGLLLEPAAGPTAPGRAATDHPAGPIEPVPGTTADRTSPATARSAPTTTAAGADTLRIEGRLLADGTEILLAWPARPPIAVLARPNELWVVLGRQASVVDADRRLLTAALSGWLKQLRREPVPGATVLRFEASRPFDVAVTADPSGWRLRLRAAGRGAPPGEPSIRREERPAGLAIGSAGTIVRLPDELLGQPVTVLATMIAGQGIASARSFVDLELLPTAQGVAWRPISDELQIQQPSGWTVISRPQGLRLWSGPAPNPPPTVVAVPTTAADTLAEHRAEPSPAVAPLPAKAEVTVPPEPMIDPSPGLRLAGWKPPPPLTVDDLRVELQRRLLLRRGGDGAPLRRDLARLHLAQARAAETLAWLGDPQAALDLEAALPGDPTTAGLAAAAAALLDRPRQARRLLDSAAAIDPRETQLWRAFVAGRLEEWEAAGAALQASQRVFNDYPPALQAKMGPGLARITLETGRASAAFAAIDRLEATTLDPRDGQRLALVKALAMARDGRQTEATALLTTLSSEASPETAIRAAFALAELRRTDGRLDDAGLADLLQAQRLQWRAHADEPVMLDRLGTADRDAGRLVAALGTWRDLIGRYPESERAASAATSMRAAFRQALATAGKAGSDPVDLLEIYRSYPELLPAGAEGRRLLTGLGRSLADLGLPGAAARLVEDSVLSRTEPQERLASALVAAEFRLRSGDLDAASALLAAQQLDATTPPAQAAQRRELEAAVRAARGDRTAAAGMIAQASPTEARRLRLAAAWERRDWPTMLSDGVGLVEGLDPATLSPADRQIVLQVGVAAAALGEQAVLAEIVGRFAGALGSEREGRLLGMLRSASPIVGDLPQTIAAVGQSTGAMRRALAAPP